MNTTEVVTIKHKEDWLALLVRSEEEASRELSEARNRSDEQAQRIRDFDLRLLGEEDRKIVELQQREGEKLGNFLRGKEALYSSDYISFLLYAGVAVVLNFYFTVLPRESVLECSHVRSSISQSYNVFIGLMT